MALCSKKQPSTTTLSITTLIFFFLLISLPQYSTSASSTNDFVRSVSLRVSPTKFANSANEVITVLQNVTSILSPFTNAFSHHSHLSNAISDCLDLLDMSCDQLSWSVSAAQNPQGKSNSTGNLSSDLRTWLSAVLVNPETCMEGLEGTFVKGHVSTGLDLVKSLVKNLFDEVVPGNDQLATATGEDRFPSWFNDEDKKFLEANEVTADAIVAADGSGNYTTVMDAVLAAPEYRMKRYVIYVKKGVYVENVEIKKQKWNIMMIGEGMNATFISGSRNHVDGWSTFRSATFAVNGRGFIACNISFQNTAGPEKEQAVALRSDSDLSVFYRCGIFGYQDSLYTHALRQFYKECKIAGTVDFICGKATVVFQRCQILAKKGKPDQKNTVTAHARTDPTLPTGFSFQFCNISADSDLLPLIGTIPTFLGRPWQAYSRTIFMQSYMSNAISPAGWLKWNESNFALDTLYYGEYMNSGPGAGVANRVKWSGYHVLNDSIEAQKFTVSQFIEGDLWLPSTGVTYTAGLAV